MSFSIKLSDFGISLPLIGVKVSDSLDISMTLFGVDKPEAKEKGPKMPKGSGK